MLEITKEKHMRYLLVIMLLFTVGCNQGTSDGTSTSTDKTVAPVTQDDSATTTPTPTTTTPTTSTPTYPTPDDTTPVTWTEQFIKLINNHRTSIGLSVLVHDDGLGDIATEHSENMAIGTVAFGHTGFSTRCSEGRAVIGGGNWCGENVAMGQMTPEAAFNAWMNSPGHRANIEQSRATHTGFGYAKSSSGRYYWTQIFIELR